MKDNGTDLTRPERSQTVDLVNDQKLVIERHEDSNVLRIVSAGGAVAVSLRVTKDGTELEIGGSALSVRARGELSIEAERVSFHGREGLELSSGGDVEFHAGGRMTSTARAHRVAAEMGDVDVYANDDVKLDGERIRMNC